MMCQRIGRSPISTIGLGRVSVSSVSREPNPPARMTVFMITPSTIGNTLVHHQRMRRERAEYIIGGTSCLITLTSGLAEKRRGVGKGWYAASSERGSGSYIVVRTEGSRASIVARKFFGSEYKTSWY